MFKAYIERSKKAFKEGMTSDLHRQSATRRIVRRVTGKDHIGDLDAARKMVGVKVKLDEEHKANAIKLMEDGCL